MVRLLIFCKIFFALFSFVDAYYGDPNSFSKFPMIANLGAASINNNIYIYGGKYIGNSNIVHNVTTLSFDENNNLAYTNALPIGDTVACQQCTAYALNDNQTIAFLGVDFSNGNVSYLGVERYNTANNTMIRPQNITVFPPSVALYASAISPNKDAIYLMGGIQALSGNISTSIYRLDAAKNFAATDLTAANPALSLSIGGASAQMLPDGKIVIAFGINHITNEHYPTTQVLIFDTVANTIRNQSVSGTPPSERAYASNSLGPDQSTIYYAGGSLRNFFLGIPGSSIKGIVILNTTSWEWIDYQIPGLVDGVYDLGSLTLFESAGGPKLLLFGGITGDYGANTISVISKLPVSGQSIQSSGIQWFTNNPDTDDIQVKSSHSLSEGAKAGIALGVLIFVAICLILSYLFFPPVKGFFVYIQNEVIWNPRIGEPLWAETTRLLVRFILLALLLAFLVFLIIRAVTSPLVIQHTRTKVTAVQVPDIRFCFNGFDGMETSVTCQFNNGTDCQQYILTLDMSVYSPTYYDNLGAPVCYLFLPGPNFYLVDQYNPYSATSDSSINFGFRTNVSTINNTYGVIHMDLYALNYDPNTYFYKLNNDTIQNYQTINQLKSWETLETGSLNVENSHIIRQTTIAGLTYEIIEQSLLADNGWNYIGLGSVYDKSVVLTTTLQDSAQNLGSLETFTPASSIASVIVQPTGFTRNQDNEQKVFTLVNTLAQAGGVFGLVVAIQTLLFGFRPQSPWGVVHRWAFGTLKISLIDRLANQFDKLGTPVPLVNPVNNRTSLLLKNKSYDGSSLDQADDPTNQEAKIKKLEERLQIMELVLQSYYLNDEIFRSIDRAVKRNSDYRRQSTLDGARRDTDSVLAHDYLNEVELATANNGYKDDIPLANLQRRPSRTTLQRDVYQPNLAPTDKFNYHDDV